MEDVKFKWKVAVTTDRYTGTGGHNLYFFDEENARLIRDQILEDMCQAKDNRANATEDGYKTYACASGEYTLKLNDIFNVILCDQTAFDGDNGEREKEAAEKTAQIIAEAVKAAVKEARAS